MENRNQNVNPTPVGPGQSVGNPNQPAAPRPPAGPRPPANRQPSQPAGPMPKPLPGAKPPSPKNTQPPSKPTTPPLPTKKSKPKEHKGSLITKILLVALFVLVIGIAGVGAFFYLGLSNKDSSLESKINESTATIAENKDKVDKLQDNASEVDTLKQKVDAMDKKSSDYVKSSKVETIMTYLKKEDSDNDGLSDYAEVMTYKSNRYKKDTDGDGYTDKEEVDGGFNPNGPGKLSDTSTSEEETTTITGNWEGDLSATSSKAEDFSIKLDEDGKVSGSFSFTKEDDTTINSRVTGTYTYKDDELDAIFINYLTVTDEEGDSSTEEQYKMDLTGSFSKSTKAIVGSWKIMGDAPANWPAGPSGSFKIAKSVVTKSETLDDDTDNGDKDDDSDSDSTSTDSTSTVAKNISVKAFSYGYLPTTITLTKDEKVKFEVTSLDVDHTFTVDDLNINVQVKGGQTSVLEFIPTEAGEYEYYSSISGQKDSGMKGTLTVEDKD